MKNHNRTRAVGGFLINYGLLKPNYIIKNDIIKNYIIKNYFIKNYITKNFYTADNNCLIIQLEKP